MRWPYANIGVVTTRTFRNLLNKIHGDIAADMQEHKDRADNLQGQINELVVNGDSSPQAAQASIGADGTDYNGNLKARLDAEYNKTTTQLADFSKKALNGPRILSMAAYPKIAPENNDNGRFSRAYADADDETTLILSDHLYELASPIDCNKKVHLLGFGTEVKAIAGLEYTLSYTGIDGLVIVGVDFNQNLMGRSALKLNSCTNFVIERCSFTGYSNEYGNSTIESGIQINDCQNGKILFCKFEDWGYQYDNSTDNLNRCISIQGTTSDKNVLIGNTFSRVNQGVVISSGNNIMLGNIFNEARDNPIYCVDNTESLIAQGNFFNAKYDECIVIKGKVFIISGNYFKNVPNKLIAQTGDVETLKLSDFVLDDSEITKGQVVVTRDKSYTIKNLELYHGQVKITSNETDYPYFYFGNVENFIIVDNNINVVTAEYHKIFDFAGTVAKGVFRNNKINGTDATAYAVYIESSVENPQIVWENNELSGCRASIKGLILKGDAKVQFNTTNPYVLSRVKNSIFFSDQMPTSGTWKTGDIAIATDTSVAQGSPLGWKCIVGGTPGTWLPFGELDLKNYLLTLDSWTSSTSSDFGYDWRQKSGEEFQFYKEKTGKVFLRGCMTGGQTTLGLRLVTLPPLYRPTRNVEILAESGGDVVILKIDTSGDITAIHGTVGTDIRIIGETQGFRAV